MSLDTAFARFFSRSKERFGIYKLWMHANPDFYNDAHHITNILGIDSDDFHRAWGCSSLSYQRQGCQINNYKRWDSLLQPLKIAYENISQSRWHDIGT
jgi:hypothetical protein